MQTSRTCFALLRTGGNCLSCYKLYREYLTKKQWTRNSGHRSRELCFQTNNHCTLHLSSKSCPNGWIVRRGWWISYNMLVNNINDQQDRFELWGIYLHFHRHVSPQLPVFVPESPRCTEIKLKCSLYSSIVSPGMQTNIFSKMSETLLDIDAVNQ